MELAENNILKFKETVLRHYIFQYEKPPELPTPERFSLIIWLLLL